MDSLFYMLAKNYQETILIKGDELWQLRSASDMFVKNVEQNLS